VQASKVMHIVVDSHGTFTIIKVHSAASKRRSSPATVQAAASSFGSLRRCTRRATQLERFERAIMPLIYILFYISINGDDCLPAELLYRKIKFPTSTKIFFCS